MRNGVVLQVQGLGVPVQLASNRVEAGYVIGWSTDAECPSDAPAHVLIGSKEIERFLRMAVDPRFLSGDLIKLVPVEVDDDQYAISRVDCISRYQINPDNWAMVRTALVIAGNTAKGPVMDMHEWIGTRDEYAQGAHMREAFQHGMNRGIKSPSVYTPDEGGHIQNAAEFLTGFRRQMKPSLRYAELLRKQIETAVQDIDLDTMHGERALNILRQIQDAFRLQQQQQLIELEELGVDTAQLQRKAHDALNQEELKEPAAQSAPRKSGPSMH